MLSFILWCVWLFRTHMYAFMILFGRLCTRSMGATRFVEHVTCHMPMCSFVSHQVFANRSQNTFLPYAGVFGGDGLYAESKIALEVLFNKWHSEGWCVAWRL